MPSPSRYQRWSHKLLNGRLGQSGIEEPDPEPDDPTDYASLDEGGAVQIAFQADVIIPADDLNETDGTVTNGSGTFPNAFINPGNANDGNDTTYAERGAGVTAPGGTVTSILKTDLGASFNVTVVTVHGRYGGGSDPVWTLEHSATGSSWTNSPVTYSWSAVAHVATLTLVTPTSDRWWRIIWDGTFAPLGFVSGLTVYTWSIAGTSTVLGDVQWYPAPAVNDGNTATSSLSNVLTDPCLRVYLLEQRLIYTIELDVGQETAGTTVYELFGTDDASFDTSTSLGTLTFTATGGYTLDATVLSWVPTASYQYYELQHVGGGGDDREFYEIRMYSAASSGGGVTDHPLLSGRSTADQHPASAITITDSDGWFFADTVETVLGELAAKAIGYQAHGNTGTTETFDAAIGWHSATLNNNCTFTLTAAPSGTVSSLFLELTQDGTGGRTITLPSSVANKADLEADQDTTLSTTSFLILLSRDGGTTWYGSWWGQDGGGSGGGVDVEDEGTPLSTTATTLNFTGAGVTATGSGTTKTITITQGTGPGTELDYVEKTTDTSITATTEATANTVVTSNSVSYDGSTPVIIEFFTWSAATPATSSVFVHAYLYDGSSSIGAMGRVRTVATVAFASPMHCIRRITPSAGSHTYSIRATTTSGTSTIGAGNGTNGSFSPAFIRITTVA